MKKNAICIIIVSAIIYFNLSFLTYAQEIRSDQYQLENEEIQFDQPGSLPAEAILSPFNKDEQELFNKNGYLSYEVQNDLFNLTIPDQTLLFDDLKAFKAVSGKATIQVMSRSSLG